MSQSGHPVALEIERYVSDSTSLLAVVMGLSLVDGVFAALVLAGALDTPVGVVQTGLLVFGGSATIAVVLADMEPSVRRQTASVLLVGVPLVALAAVEAVLAPTIGSVLDLGTFQWFAGLVLLTLAARVASAHVAELLPSPGLVVGLGVLASLDLTGASLVIVADPALALRAAAAALVGVLFALAGVAVRPKIGDVVDIDRFRFGSAVALGTLALSVLGFLPGDAPLPLAVLGVTALLSINPADDGGESDSETSRGDADGEEPVPLH